MSIWKFPLVIRGTQHIDAPKGWKPLHIGMQNDKPMLWAMVDPTADVVSYDIRCIGTGHDTDLPPESYLGTVSMSWFVWHFFWASA